MSVTIRLTFDDPDMTRASAVELAEHLAAEAEKRTGEAPWWAIEEDEEADDE